MAYDQSIKVILKPVMLFAELMWLSVSDSYRWGKDGLCGRSMVCRRLNFFNCLRKSILWVVFSFTVESVIASHLRCCEIMGPINLKLR